MEHLIVFGLGFGFGWLIHNEVMRQGLKALSKKHKDFRDFCLRIRKEDEDKVTEE